MDKPVLLERIFWNIQASWHLRRRPTTHELSVKETVKGLQHVLLDQQATMLLDTLHQVFTSAIRLEDLQRLEISLYQEGADQRVWRAQATLTDGRSHAFGLIVARAPGAETAVTQRDFTNLKTLYARQQRYCVQPYVAGTIPIADGVAAYTVEWLPHHKELVFEIARDGGVFLINAHGAHHVFTPAASRQIWQHIIEILWCYCGLCNINIQAGDFVGLQRHDGRFELKLTTARDLRSKPGPAAHLHMILRSVITASGYLSDGRQPFNRQMPKSVFQHRMQAVLQRRFGNQAEHLAHQQWHLLQNGAFAQQEDWLKEDCIRATYNFLRAKKDALTAWQQTRHYWMAYVDAVQANVYPESWWFPSAEIPAMLNQLTPTEIDQ
jgi:hypothetical protein